MKANVTIKNLLLLAKCSDGKVRQVIFTEQMQNHTLNMIVKIEGAINIIEKEIDGIDFESKVKLM